MLCVPWDREPVAQADAPHVVLVVDGRAEIMAHEPIPNEHARGRIVSHTTGGDFYLGSGVEDLTTSCLLVARDGSSIVELWDGATTDDFDGGLTYEHGGIEIVAVDREGANWYESPQIVMAEVRGRDPIPADVGFVTLMAYLHFDEEAYSLDTPWIQGYRFRHAEISWRIHEYDTLQTVDEVTGALAAALRSHPATDPNSPAVFQEGSYAWV